MSKASEVFGALSALAMLASGWIPGLSSAVAWILRGVGVGAGLVASHNAKMAQPSFGSAPNGNFDSHSPTYGWDGITTTQDAGIPLPIVYGEHRLGGNIINMFVDSNKQYEFMYKVVIPTDYASSGTENTFSITEYVTGVKFRLKNIVRTRVFSGQAYTYYAGYRISWWPTATPLVVSSRNVPQAAYTGLRTDYIDVNVLSGMPTGFQNYTFKIEIIVSPNDTGGDAYIGVNYSPLGIMINPKTAVTTKTDERVLNILLALCEGEIESIDDIQINNNPSGNFTSVEFQERYGTNDQDIIPNFDELVSTYAINSQLLKNSAYTYTTADSDVEGFEVAFSLPSGLYQVDDNGNIASWEINYKVEYKLHAAGTWTDMGTFLINSKTRTQGTKVFRKTDLTAGQYDIRVTKTSNDSDFNHVGDIYIQSIGEIKTDDLAYPNTALLGVKILASDQLSGGIPNITAVVKGRKVSVPQVMNGAVEVAWEDYYWDPDATEYKLLADDTSLTWDGTTYVSRYSANPIWCIKDLLLNTRFGLGEFIDSSLVSAADFLSMAQHCDELVPDGKGEYEKRYRLDIVIDGMGKAIDLLAQLAMSCHGFVFYSGGQVKVKIDRAEDPVQLFGMGNIIQGSLQQTWTGVKDIPNVIEIQFMDKDKDYRQETVAVMDEAALAAGEPVRKRQVRLFTTRTSYALRAGRYAINFAKLVDRTVSFKASIDAVGCQAGDVISVSHDVPQWGFSGRVGVGSTTTSIVLDRTVTVAAATTYKLQVRFADDTIEERTVSSAAGNHSTLTVSSAFSAAPAAYDVYAFGVENQVKQDFRIISIQRTPEGEVEIGAVKYDPNVYDDTAVVLPTPSASALRLDTPDVLELELTERIVKTADGSIEDVIDIWFQKPYNADYFVKAYAKARIYLSDDTGKSWVFRGETTTEQFSIIGGIKDGSTYTVAVVSVDDKGREKAIASSPQDTITVAGKTAAPADVAGFTAVQVGDEIVFRWTANQDIDLKSYEIRSGESWDNSTHIAQDIVTNYARVPIPGSGVKVYRIKAIDTSGNYSENDTNTLLYVNNGGNIDLVQTDNLAEWLTGTLENVEFESYALMYDNSGDAIVLSTGEPLFTTDGYLSLYKELDIFTGEYTVVDEGRYTSVAKALPAEMLAYIWVRISTESMLSYNAYEPQNKLTYDLEIRTSLDGTNWTAWQTYTPQEYYCKHYQVRLTLHNADPQPFGFVWELKADISTRFLEEGGQDVTVPAAGLTVQFSNAYKVKARLWVQPQGNRYVDISEKGLTGFTVTVRDAVTNAAVEGTIDWVTKGY